MSDTGGGRRLSGKRVLITGASSGVGMAAARHFVADGATVALLARRVGPTVSVAFPRFPPQGPERLPAIRSPFR